MEIMEFFFRQKESGGNAQNNIKIDKYGKYLKMTIGDDVSMQEYSQVLKDNSDVKLDTFTFNVIWDKSKQMVGKGEYYAFEHNDNRYIIGITDDKMMIDERQSGEVGSENKFLTMYQDRECDLLKCINDEFGSCVEQKCYSSRGNDYVASKMSREEFIADCESVFASLKTFKGIPEIIDAYQALIDAKDACVCKY